MKTLSILLFSILIGHVQAQASAYSWDKTVHKEDHIILGKSYLAKFVLTNKGQSPIVLTALAQDHECSLKTPRAPVMAGRSATVEMKCLFKKGAFRSKSMSLSLHGPKINEIQTLIFQSHVITLRVNECLEQKYFYKNNYRYPRSSRITINTKILGQCFYGLHASKWDSTYLLDAVYLFELYPQLLKYLMGRKSVHYFSGHEDQLREWVLSQPENSIDPHRILKKSLELNDGDLFRSILTIHDLLRGEGRYFTKYSHYQSTHQQRNEFFNRFVDIRGDLEENCNEDDKGDHIGSWYRFWGTMLDAMNSVVIFGDKVYGEGFISGYGFMSSTIAEWVKPFSPKRFKEIDKRKIKINLVGYKVMESFYLNLEANSSPEEMIKKCDPLLYLQDHRAVEARH